MSEEQVLFPSDAPAVDAPAVAGQSPAETTSTPAAETTEVDSGDAAADPEQAEADKALKRGKNYYGRKIDTLTREREQERAEKLRLMAMLEQRATAPAPAAPAAQDQAPRREQFGDIEDFFKAQARYEARQEASQQVERHMRAIGERQQTEALHRQAQGMVESFNKRLATGIKDYADFEDVVQGEGADIQVGNAAAAIAESDNPAGVMYFLAKNRAQAERIAGLSPLKAAIEIGRIDANLKTKPQVSNAPAPGKPVGSKPGSSGEPPEDTAAYFAWAEKNMR
jgi:hypothetical protein